MTNVGDHLVDQLNAENLVVLWLERVVDTVVTISIGKPHEEVVADRTTPTRWALYDGRGAGARTARPIMNIIAGGAELSISPTVPRWNSVPPQWRNRLGGDLTVALVDVDRIG